MPITGARTDIAADTIVSMPTSLSGYKHVAHVHCISSNYGKVFCIRTKVCADEILYWIKGVQLRMGKPILRLHIDGGEVKTSKLVDAMAAQGTEIVENLADVHSNTSIERRHRDVIRTNNAQMHTGAAGSLLWEFSMTNANAVINLCMPIKQMRALGQQRNAANRPLSSTCAAEASASTCECCGQTCTPCLSSA